MLGFTKSDKSATKTSAKAIPTALRNLPQWRQHPAYVAHQERLASARQRLPELAHTHTEAARDAQEAQQALDRQEVLQMAGQGSQEAVSAATQRRDAAKKALAIATLAHEETAHELDLLERGAGDVEDAARAEVARQLSDTYTAALDAFAEALAGAVEANELCKALASAIKTQYPGDQDPSRPEYCWTEALGTLSVPYWHDLQGRITLYDFMGNAGAMNDTRYTVWLAEYKRFKRDRLDYAKKREG